MRFALCLLVLACCGDEFDCYQNLFANVTSYVVRPSVETSSGFSVDPSGFTDIDYVALDQRLRNIELCLIQLAPRYTHADREAGQCIRRGELPAESFKSCLVIKIVAPLFSRCSPDERFVDALAPQYLCEDKGLAPISDCPCRWRTAVQDERYLIVPHEPVATMHLWQLVAIYTSCNNFWETEFAACASL